MSTDLRAARKETQPYRAARPQPWAADTIETGHEEVLYSYGEMGLFTLMWRPVDFENGLVGRCQTCFGDGAGQMSADERRARAFQQPTKRKCPDCYGTTYEGGYRAQIVRPLLMADRNSEIDEEERGVVTVDTIQFETTSDFVFHRGDYLIRSTNDRYQCEEKNEIVLRTGFAPPLREDSMSGISVAHLEEKTSVAFLLPPVNPSLLLDSLMVSGPFTSDTSSLFDTIRPGGYLMDGVPEQPTQGHTDNDVLVGHGPPPPSLVMPPNVEYLDLDTGDLYESS